MKLSFVIPNLKSGGAEKVLCKLLNELVKNKKHYIIHLILVKKEGALLDDLNDKIIIFNIDKSHARQSLYGLVRYLRSEKPDFLISSLDYMNVISSIAHIISWSYAKLILWEHNNLSIHTKKTLSSSSILNKIIIWFFYCRANKIISVSNGVKHSLVRDFKVPSEKVTTIYNPGYDENIIKHSKKNDSDIFKFGKYIISVGRLAKQKNYYNLLNAFKYIIQEGNEENLNLVIVGEGPEKKNILNKIESMGLTGRVILVGFKQNPMPLIMNSCLFVLSSNNEGFGLVLIEALALKKQIVSTDCPSGPREILMDGKFGQLVPVNDSKKLAISIQKSIEGQINFNENSLLKRAKYFNLERFYKSFLLMIENI